MTALMEATALSKGDMLWITVDAHPDCVKGYWPTAGTACSDELSTLRQPDGLQLQIASSGHSVLSSPAPAAPDKAINIVR
jgi:hypothetical protein